MKRRKRTWAKLPGLFAGVEVGELPDNLPSQMVEDRREQEAVCEEEEDGDLDLTYLRAGCVVIAVSIIY